MMHQISNLYGLIIHHISDTHGKEWIMPYNSPDIDIIIHSGDATNQWDLALNTPEFEAFIDWYSKLPIPIKIFVPGNHDAFCFHQEKDARRICKEAGIEYLNKDSFSIYGLNFYGDPMTPVFGQWHFTTSRDKIYKHWELIPENVDVLITHGPPKGILDLSYHGACLEFCGDMSLRRRIEHLNIKLHCFGHIHNSKTVTNVGIRELDGVFYSNAAAVRDSDSTRTIRHQGNTFKF